MGIRIRKGTPGNRLFPSRLAVVRLGAARLATAALAAACTATAGLADETADAPTLGGSSPPAEAIEHYSDGLRALEAQDFRSAAFEFEAGRYADALDATGGSQFDEDPVHAADVGRRCGDHMAFTTDDFHERRVL